MVQLRLATMDDAGMLLRWRNDPTTYEHSVSAEAVMPEKHAAWLDQVLQNPLRRLYIAEADGGPVGTGRLDSDTEAMELSLTVAPEARGKGYGGQIVAALVEAARREWPACLLVAHVQAGNTASLRAFLKIGFVAQGDELLRLELGA